MKSYVSQNDGLFHNNRTTPIIKGKASFINSLQNFESLTWSFSSSDMDKAMLENIIEETDRFLAFISKLEPNLTESERSSLHRDILSSTESLVTHSWFFDYARNWPEGYAGDYRVMDAIVQTIPKSATTFGKYLDLLFLNQPFAKAIVHRFSKMMEMLKHNFYSLTESSRVLSVNCGSSREIFLLQNLLAATGAEITCIDANANAVETSQRLFSESSLNPDKVTCQRFNLLKLLNDEKITDQFRNQDVIFSSNLFEIFTDQVTTRMVAAVYSLLEPGGVMLIAQHDTNLCDMQLVKWLTRWESFFNRSIEHCLELIVGAGLENASIRVEHTESESMNIIAINKH